MSVSSTMVLFFLGRVLYRVHYVEHFETLCQCLQYVPNLSSKVLMTSYLYYIIGNKLSDSFEISDLIKLLW